MRKDPKAFRERFNAWKNGELVYDAGRPITDALYEEKMKLVGRNNYVRWGFDTPEEAAKATMNEFSYSNGKDDNETSSWANALIGASVADAPAVATAAGWKNKDGKWVQLRTEADEKLAKNLSVLSTTVETNPMNIVLGKLIGAGIKGGSKAVNYANKLIAKLRLLSTINNILKQPVAKSTYVTTKPNIELQVLPKSVFSLQPYNPKLDLTENFYNSMYPDLIKKYDIQNAYKDAVEYAESTNRLKLFDKIKKQAAQEGYISLNSQLNLPLSSLSIPSVRFTRLKPNINGKYNLYLYEATFDPAKINGSATPFHEFLHANKIGESYTKNLSNSQSWENAYNQFIKTESGAEELSRLAEDAEGMDKFYVDKIKKRLLPDADAYSKSSHEFLVHWLTEGKRLGIKPYSEKPSYREILKLLLRSLKETNSPVVDSFMRDLNEGNKYLDDYWDLLTGQFLPTAVPVVVGSGAAVYQNLNNLSKSYKHGKDSGIHIKPSHRGRLTALKKRTGKSEAELYKTGGPAVRKMITFARNARKWKH